MSKCSTNVVATLQSMLQICEVEAQQLVKGLKRGTVEEAIGA